MRCWDAALSQRPLQSPTPPQPCLHPLGRARDNKLAPHEFTGGSFTISNLGMFGVTSFAAIINPPQACILAVGGSQRQAVMRGGELTEIECMTVTLSADNRVVSEEVAAEFLTAFATHIENPGVMLVK